MISHATTDRGDLTRSPGPHQRQIRVRHQVLGPASIARQSCRIAEHLTERRVVAGRHLIPRRHRSSHDPPSTHSTAPRHPHSVPANISSLTGEARTDHAAPERPQLNGPHPDSLGVSRTAAASEPALSPARPQDSARARGFRPTRDLGVCSCAAVNRGSSRSRHGCSPIGSRSSATEGPRRPCGEARHTRTCRRGHRLGSPSRPQRRPRRVRRPTFYAFSRNHGSCRPATRYVAAATKATTAGRREPAAG